MQPSELYRGARERIAGLVADLDDASLDAVVPATPDWRVRDLLAHCVGVPADVVAGRVDGAASDPWTAAQVARRQGRSVDELLAEWGEVAPEVEPLMDTVPQLGRAVFDLLSHEQDLRGALDRPGCDPGALEAITEGAVVTLVNVAQRAGMPLRVQVAGSDVTGGPDNAPLGVTAPSGFELFRAVLGRRSRDQVLAWNWSADPAPQIDSAFFLFGPRAEPLHESDPTPSG